MRQSKRTLRIPSDSHGAKMLTAPSAIVTISTFFFKATDCLRFSYHRRLTQDKHVVCAFAGKSNKGERKTLKRHTMNRRKKTIFYPILLLIKQIALTVLSATNTTKHFSIVGQIDALICHEKMPRGDHYR